MYGDSTVLGTTKRAGAYAVTSRNAVSQLDKMLTAVGYHVKLSNHGVNMIITDDLLDGTRGVARSWVAEMIERGRYRGDQHRLERRRSRAIGLG